MRHDEPRNVYLSILLPRSRSGYVFRFVRVPTGRSILLEVVVCTGGASGGFSISLLRPVRGGVVEGGLVLRVCMERRAITTGPKVSVRVEGLRVAILPGEYPTTRCAIVTKRVATSATTRFPTPSRVVMLVRASIRRLRCLPNHSGVGGLHEYRARGLRPMKARRLPRANSNDHRF